MTELSRVDPIPPARDLGSGRSTPDAIAPRNPVWTVGDLLAACERDPAPHAAAHLGVRPVYRTLGAPIHPRDPHFVPPRFCNACDHVHPTTRAGENAEKPWRWRCLKAPARPGYGWVHPTYAPEPPYRRCADVNDDGRCAHFAPLRTAPETVDG